jgi:outer membrane protein
MTLWVLLLFALQGHQPLSLQDCIKTALANHARVRQAELSLLAAESGLVDAKSGYLPYLSANGSWQKNQRAFNGSETRSESRGGDLSITETLFDNGATLSQVRRAKATLKSAEFALRQARNDLAADVAVSYYSLLAARQAREVSRESLRLAEEQLKEIDARIEAEVAARADRYPLVARVAEAKVNLTQAENNVRQSATALRNVMGLPLGEELDIAEAGEPGLPDLAFDSLLAQAKTQRPEIGRAVAQLESSAASLWQARLQAGPRLSVSGGYSRILEPPPVGDEWNATARLSIPLWDFGASRAGVKSAEATQESAQRSLEQTQKDVAAEVERAYLALKSSAEAYAAAKTNTEAARVSLQAAQEKFRVGAAITLEVTDAQLRYFEALLTEARAKYDFFTNLILLQRAVGLEPGSADLSTLR